MRRFRLYREIDVSGVSGTGIVAEGIQFSSGLLALSFISDKPSVEIHTSIDNLEKIHGHKGKTSLQWIDNE